MESEFQKNHDTYLCHMTHDHVVLGKLSPYVTCTQVCVKRENTFVYKRYNLILFQGKWISGIQRMRISYVTTKMTILPLEGIIMMENMKRCPNKDY